MRAVPTPRMCARHGSIFVPPGGYVEVPADRCPLTVDMSDPDGLRSNAGDEPHGDEEVE